jgi:hypothetical protein
MFTGGPGQQQPSGGGGGGGSGPQNSLQGHNFPAGDMPVYEQGNILRSHETMYRLIISQLFYDGYTPVAIQLTNLLTVDPPCPPSERLLHVLTKALDREADEKVICSKRSRNNL